MATTRLSIDESLDGMRLDKAVHTQSSFGLRGVRRLIERGMVLVNGVPGKSAQKVRRGDSVCISLEEGAAVDVSVLHRQSPYIFLAKPRFLHTVDLTGSVEPSLWASAKTLFGDTPPILAQRLDYQTSGIVCCVEDRTSYQAFRRDEKRGLVGKTYCALLEGRVEKPLCLREELLVSDRSKTGVSSALAPHNRWTHIVPYAYIAEPYPSWLLVPQLREPLSLTLCVCTICCGARHQIRAHAGMSGHPLAGDTLYGAQSRFVGEPNGAFYLHQAHISLPGASCTYLPPWIAKAYANTMAASFGKRDPEGFPFAEASTLRESSQAL
ncbi:MAG: hypothetical protein IJS54_04145 [Desulfovibrio sp.]|nr:hypothetical protein [Desulfovibrio sp.]